MKRKLLSTSIILLFLLGGVTFYQIPSIKPSASTIHLSDAGWSDPTIGDWDPSTKTGTLTQDVADTIQIDSDGIILDGDGFKITGGDTGFGVYLPFRTDVTIKNLNVSQFTYGIHLWYSSGNTLSEINATDNYYGIRLWYSNDNTLNDTIASNNYVGIAIFESNDNILSDNTVASNTVYGIDLGSSSHNTLTCNDAISNLWGIRLFSSPSYSESTYNTLTDNNFRNNNFGGIVFESSSSNTLTGNSVSNNHYGIYLSLSNDNTFTGNTISYNSMYGLIIFSGDNNWVYNNNFIENHIQATDKGIGNVFNLDSPIGGNYWSDWTTPDEDDNGFVDFPYVFIDGQDNLPWASINGWLITYTQQINQELQSIIDENPDTELADKAADVMIPLNIALDALGETPPNNLEAMRKMEDAVKDLDVAVEEGLDPEQATQLKDQLAGIARQLAVDALNQALADPNSNQDFITEAQDYLGEGDMFRESGAFEEAIDKYKDSGAKAEGALP